MIANSGHLSESLLWLFLQTIKEGLIKTDIKYESQFKVLTPNDADNAISSKNIL